MILFLFTSSRLCFGGCFRDETKKDIRVGVEPERREDVPSHLYAFRCPTLSQIVAFRWLPTLLSGFRVRVGISSSDSRWIWISSLAVTRCQEKRPVSAKVFIIVTNNRCHFYHHQSSVTWWSILICCRIKSKLVEAPLSLIRRRSSRVYDYSKSV